MGPENPMVVSRTRALECSWSLLSGRNKTWVCRIMGTNVRDGKVIFGIGAEVEACGVFGNWWYSFALFAFGSILP